MFFRKKHPEIEAEENTTSEPKVPRTATGTYAAAQEVMDKNLEQKKQTMSAAQRLARRIGDTFPPVKKTKIA